MKIMYVKLWLLTIAGIFGIVVASRGQGKLDSLIKALPPIRPEARANFARSLRYCFDSLALAETRHDTATIIKTCNRIGLIYFRSSNPEKAKAYFQRCLDIKVRFKDQGNLDRLYINLGAVYGKTGDYKTAERWITEGLERCIFTGTDVTRIEGNYAMGMALLGQRRFDETKDRLAKTIQLSEKGGDIRMLANTLAILSITHIQRGEFTKATSIITRGVALCRNSHYDAILLQLYSHKIFIHETNGEYEEAADAQALYTTLQQKFLSMR